MSTRRKLNKRFVKKEATGDNFTGAGEIFGTWGSPYI